MKVVYLAGPYRADTEYEVHCNIEAASMMAFVIWRLGAVCICPHKNTAYFGGALSDDVWLEGDKELIRRSDAVLMMATFGTSAGARAESVFAIDCGKPVFYLLADLEEWLKEQEQRT